MANQAITSEKSGRLIGRALSTEHFARGASNQVRGATPARLRRNPAHAPEKSFSKIFSTWHHRKSEAFAHRSRLSKRILIFQKNSLTQATPPGYIEGALTRVRFRTAKTDLVEASPGPQRPANPVCSGNASATPRLHPPQGFFSREGPVAFGMSVRVRNDEGHGMIRGLHIDFSRDDSAILTQNRRKCCILQSGQFTHECERLRDGLRQTLTSRNSTYAATMRNSVALAIGRTWRFSRRISTIP